MSSSAVAGPSRPKTGPPSSAPSPPVKRTAYDPIPATIEPFFTGSGPTTITSDGRLLFTAIDDQVLCTDLSQGTGVVIERLQPDGEDISSVTLTPSSSHLCITTRAATCTLFTYVIESFAPTFKVNLLRTTPRAHDAPVAISTVDETGTLLATGSADGVVKVWDIHGGFVTHVLRGHGGIVSAIAFDLCLTEGADTGKPRSNLVSSSVDGRVRVWDLLNRPTQGVQKPIATLGGHVSVVRGLDVSRDGSRMISGARDKTVCLWETITTKGGKKAKEVSNVPARWNLKATLSVGEGVEACGFVDDAGDEFFTGGTSSELRIWSFTSGSVQSVQPRGRWAKSSYKAGQESGEDEDLQGIVGVHYLSKRTSGAVPSLISFHADSRIVFRSATLAVAGGDDQRALPALSRTRQIVGFNDEAVDLAVLGSGEEQKQVAVATNSSAIRIYPLPQLNASVGEDDAAASTPLPPGSVHLLPAENSEPGHSDVVLCIGASTNGDLLASGSKDRTARVWGYSAVEDEWKCVAIAEGHAESVGAVCFSKKSSHEGGIGANFLVTASQDRTVKIWDLSTLSPSSTPSAPIRLRSLVTLKVHEKAINAIEVAPNDSLLVTASQDRTSKLFTLSFSPPSKANAHTAVAKLTPLATLKGHKRGVWSVGFSPVDAALFTTSGDRSAKLWSLKDLTCVKTYEGHSHSVLKGAFLDGSRGTQLLTCGADGLIKIWAVRDEECLATLEGSPDALAGEEQRLWSVSSFANGSGIVTVGGDGCIRFWKDVTAEREREKLRERQIGVEREQRFENLLLAEDYREAILLCLAEGQPKRLLGLFGLIARKRDLRRSRKGMVVGQDSASRLLSLALSDGGGGGGGDGGDGGRNETSSKKQDEDLESITGLASVDEVLSTLPLPLLRTLLYYIRTWNASSRTSTIAQSLLHVVLRKYPPQRIMQAFHHQTNSRSPSSALLEGLGSHRRPGGRTGGGAGGGVWNTTLPQLLEGLLPYSERHYARAERTLIEASILEYTVRMMGDVLEEDGVRGGLEGRTSPLEGNGRVDDDDDEQEGEEDMSDSDVNSEEEESEELNLGMHIDEEDGMSVDSGGSLRSDQ